MYRSRSHRKSLDKVDPEELKGKHADRDDKDIDNDGDSDDSDKYLHRRRQAIASRRKKDDTKEEVEVDEKYTQTQRNIKDISRDYSTTSGSQSEIKKIDSSKGRKATSKGQNVATDRQTDRKHGGDTVVNRKSEERRTKE